MIRPLATYVLVATLLLAVLAPSGSAQTPTRRPKFQVAQTTAEQREQLINQSRGTRNALDAFKDRNGDGIFDSIYIPGAAIGTLDVDVNVQAAQGFSYSSIGDVTRRVVFYPAREVRIPRDGEYLVYGFVHYFDSKDLSNWFAAVVYKVPTEEGSTKPKTSPYQADFIDRAGNRVGTPKLLLLNTSALGSNVDFQRWQKSDDEVVLAYNPIAESRELYIFRKIPQLPDKVMMLFFRWF